MPIPKNYATGIEYRGKNIPKLIDRCCALGFDPSRSFWLTFIQAKRLGGTVKKGEKGARLLFAGSVERIHPDTGEVIHTRIARGFTVFHIGQCDFGDNVPTMGSLHIEMEAAD